MNRDFKGIWIPKEIWLSKVLTLQEKVFLVEIDSLDNNEGCFATNKYFSEFFSVSKTRASLVIKSLINKGFITSKIIYVQNTKQVDKRVLSVVKNERGYLTKVKEGIQQNLNTPGQQKLKDNNISFNNTNNNIYNKIFSYYMSLNLIKHRRGITNDIKKAIDKAKKECGYDLEDMKTLLDRHKKVIDITKNSKYPVRVRGLKEFFGQKIIGSTSLICTQYEEGGKYYDRYIKDNENDNSNVDYETQKLIQERRKAMQGL